jgi:rhomboid family GlyGly-CTERM serine protease
MTSRQIPILTIGLTMMLIGLHFLVVDKTQLYFSATDIARGDTWRLITGHFMHADTQHLFWNCLGLLVLGALIERHSRPILWAALCAGIASVSILLLTPFSQLDYYCGLSGVLNTLLLLALWLEWRRTRSWLVILIGCGSIAKVIIELTSGSSIVTHISWPPYAWSHIAGLAGGLIVISGLSVPFDHHPAVVDDQ